MMARPHVTRLLDILETIERIRDGIGDLPIDRFEADWRTQWLIERDFSIPLSCTDHGGV